MKWKKNQVGGRKVAGQATTLPIGHKMWTARLPIIHSNE